MTETGLASEREKPRRLEAWSAMARSGEPPVEAPSMPVICGGRWRTGVRQVDRMGWAHAYHTSKTETKGKNERGEARTHQHLRDAEVGVLLDVGGGDEGEAARRVQVQGLAQGGVVLGLLGSGIGVV